MPEEVADPVDAARTDELGPAVNRLLPALDSFLRFPPGPDPAAERSAWRPRLDQPLPEIGVGADAVLDELAGEIVPRGLRVGAPGFCSWVTTAPTVVPAAATLAATIAASQRWWVHPGNTLEGIALRWITQLLGLPESFAGAFVSGGATANLLCLSAARQHAGERIGVDPVRDGAGAIPFPRVYAPESVHRVVVRALAVLGLGETALRRVPVDEHGRPDLARLQEWIDEDVGAGRTPVAVVASAGDVNLGRVDPLDDMREIAQSRSIWFHVDGAYGALGVLDPRVRPLYGHLGAVDSLATDPHKWMAAPVGCGAGLVRDAELLGRALAMERADYAGFAAGHGPDPGSPFDELGEGSLDHTFEHSAAARGLVVWALLKEIGARGMRDRVRRHLDCARRVAERVRAIDDLELLAEPVLSICCFRYRPPGVADDDAVDNANEAILSELRARGRAVPSGTRVRGRFAIRPCFIGPRSTLVDADALVDEVLAVAGALGYDDPGRYHAAGTQAMARPLLAAGPRS
jgi:aromatic-L-amino-acid decarboxylase